ILDGFDKGTGWCHISPANVKDNVVEIRGKSFYMDSNSNITNPEDIPQAKGTGRIIDSSAVLEQVIKYWTNSEADKTKGFHFYQDNTSQDSLWHSYLDKGGTSKDAFYDKVPTLAYGLQLPYSSKEFQIAAKYTGYVEGTLYTCTDEAAMLEARNRIQGQMAAVDKKLG